MKKSVVNRKIIMSDEARNYGEYAGGRKIGFERVNISHSGGTTLSNPLVYDTILAFLFKCKAGESESRLNISSRVIECTSQPLTQSRYFGHP
jgi:hypothetical protein